MKNVYKKTARIIVEKRTFVMRSNLCAAEEGRENRPMEEVAPTEQPLQLRKAGAKNGPMEDPA